MHFATFVIAALVAAVSAKEFTAWSGAACDGNMVVDVDCAGQCVDVPNGFRSFEANMTQPCLTIYTQAGCGSQRIDVSGRGNKCTDVTLASSILKSFRCSSGPTCSGA